MTYRRFLSPIYRRFYNLSPIYRRLTADDSLFLIIIYDVEAVLILTNSTY